MTVPEVDLVKPPVPVKLPLTVPERTSNPALLLRVPLVMVPDVSVTWPTVSVLPPRSSVPPDTVTAPVPRASALPVWRVPALTVTPPENPLLLPERVTVPEVVLARLLLPPMRDEMMPDFTA